MVSKTRCTWGGSEHGWLTAEHVRGCDDNACSGCKPCPKTHCAMRGRCANHVDSAIGHRTCPSCIGKTRGDLTAIVTLHTLALPVEAEFAGVDSDAVNLVGPAALSAHVDYRRGYCEFPKRDDQQHPYAVLGRWDLAMREQFGPATDLTITVTRAADYLTGLLAGPFPHGDEFEDFTREMAACRAHLETVIHDSRTPERGRPCPRCAEDATGDKKAPRLAKRYASGTSVSAVSGDLDTWHCPAEPAHWWSERDYRDRVEADYVQHAGELPARELSERIEVPLSTVRKWALRTWDEGEKAWRKPLLESRRKSADGRKLYRVADALRIAERRA